VDKGIITWDQIDVWEFVQILSIVVQLSQEERAQREREEESEKSNVRVRHTRF
jgi:hypothetical protein